MFNISFNRRHITLCITIFATLILVGILISGLLITKDYYSADFSSTNLPPSSTHLFGTDFMGRDMFYRTLKGLSTGMQIGLCASFVSCIMAVICGFSAGVLGKKVDLVICGLVDLMRSIPAMLFLVLISIAMGRGVRGITLAVILTHWTPLTRIIRAEILALKNTQFYKASQRMGKSNLWIARHHILPHIIPQFVIGLIILFPHAIMHEAGLTFLGFGIPSEIPAIGGILEESMHYITSGYWWLSVLPGLSLLFVVMLFEIIGDNVRRLIDPFSAQE
ncbi:MAG: ABC transporter permease [Eubacteriales bacterium]